LGQGKKSWKAGTQEKKLERNVTTTEVNWQQVSNKSSKIDFERL